MNRSIFDEKTKVWRGEGAATVKELNTNLSLGTAILNALEKRPDHVGQISDNNGVILLNSEIRIRSIRAAQNLLKLGLQSGDVIQVFASNHHYLAPIVFGAMFIGAPVNALDVKFTKDEIVHMLELVTPKLIICDYDVACTIQNALKSIQTVVPMYAFNGEDYQVHSIEDLLVETDSEEEFKIDDLEVIKHPVIIVCTSGTTGHPKGVCLSHSSLLESNLRAGGDVEADPAGHAFLNFSSLYWLSGWSTLIGGTLKSVKRIITTKPFLAERFLQLIEQHKVTYVLTPPFYMAMTLQEKSIETTDLSSVRMYVVTGGMVSHDLCMRMNKHLKNGVVVVVYAMSETSGAVAFGISALQPNSVGPLLPGVVAKIINDYGESCLAGIVGEICFLPNYPFMGYYRDEVNTKKTVDELGFIHSGDLGYFDENGILYVVGRNKEILKYFGSQVSPSEIEDVILKHSGVCNVCVVGIPDEMAGELPAAVVMRNNVFEVTEDDINKLIKEKLSDPKQIRGGIYFVDELPTNPSGKVLRRKALEVAMEKFNARK